MSHGQEDCWTVSADVTGTLQQPDGGDAEVVDDGVSNSKEQSL
jgi:hypothetical protein